MTKYLTRRDRRFELERLGVGGEALTSLLDETSAERHQSRVDYARAMAEEYFLAQVGEEIRGYDVTRLAAVPIAWLDVIGVGGRHGVEGLASCRHPAFSSCGKGRKRAGDGDAWTAAIFCVCADVDGRFAVNEEGSIRFEVESEGSSILVDETLSPTAWRMSLAREGLRRAAGLRPWHKEVPIESTPPTLPAWGAAVNAIAAEVAAEAVAVEAVAVEAVEA